jgi:hypothetical protein
MHIQGLQGMSAQEIQLELQRGARFVVYSYCVSLIVITFRRQSQTYFVRAGERRLGKSLPSTLLTILLGWWGIPWGPIYSVQALLTNFKGGRDVTADFAPRRCPATVSVSPVDEIAAGQ